MGTIYDRINGALATLGKRRPRPWGEEEQPAPGGAGGADRPRGDQPPPAKLQHQLLFRPFSQEDLHQRLQTFKPLNWFARPDKASAIECAIHGWMNSGRDTLSCTFCSAQLRYPQSIAPDHRNTAAELFAQQLVSKHASHCPWRNTHSPHSLLEFQPPADASEHAELLRRFEQRHQRLMQVELLPDLSTTVMQQLQVSDPAAFQQAVLQIRSQEAPGRPTPAPTQQTDDAAAATPARAERMPSTPAPTPTQRQRPGAAPPKLTNAERARMLALLGWDMEVLSADSGAAALLSRPDPGQYSLLHLMAAPGKQRGTKPPAQAQQQQQQQQRVSASSVLLTCSECKARVGLWNFARSQAPPVGRLTAAAAAAAETPSPSSPAHLGTSPAPSASRAPEAAAPGAGGVQGPNISMALNLTIAGGSFGRSSAGVAAGPFGAAASSGPFGRQHEGVAVFGRPGRAQAQAQSQTPTPAPAPGPGPADAGPSETPAPAALPSAGLKRRAEAADSDAAAAATTSAETPDVNTASRQLRRSSKRPRHPSAATTTPTPSPLQAALGLFTHWASAPLPATPPPAGAAAAATAATASPAPKPAAACTPSLASAAAGSGYDAFDAVGHHRSWCPWTYAAHAAPAAAALPASPRSPAAGAAASPAARASTSSPMSPTATAAGTPAHAAPEVHPAGWLYLMKLVAEPAAAVPTPRAADCAARGREAAGAAVGEVVDGAVGSAAPTPSSGPAETGAGGARGAAAGGTPSKSVSLMQGVVQGMKEVLRRR